MKTTEMSVELIDHMGSDLSVVNAARVSMHKESGWEFDHANGETTMRLPDKDAKLIKYLAEHNHWTPFGHAFASFRIKAPIFVARQLVKHQVGLVWNEVSRRYVDEEPEFWFPVEWRGRPEGSIKQGSSGVVQRSFYASNTAVYVCKKAAEAYRELLNIGVAPEQARMVLPQNTMTEWIWSGSLAAWARVCKLRLEAHAQIETRIIADFINNDMAKVFPVSWGALK